MSVMFYRELEGRQARKIAHAEYMKTKNKNNSRYRDNRANRSRKSGIIIKMVGKALPSIK